MTECDLCKRNAAEQDLRRFCCAVRGIAMMASRSAMSVMVRSYAKGYGHDEQALREAVKARLRAQAEAAIQSAAPR